MLEFLFISLLWLFKPIYFLLFTVMFSFLIFNNFSWGGLFLVLDSYSFILLIVMSLFILGIIVISEKK